MFRGIRAKIPMFGIIRARILKFERIRTKFQGLKDTARIPVFGRTRPEFQCLERWGQNSSVSK